MGKKLFGNVRTQLVGTIVAAIGGVALAACSNSCNPCNTCTPVYKKPCCAQTGGGMASCGAKPAPAPAAKPAGGQMACGAGKCG